MSADAFAQSLDLLAERLGDPAPAVYARLFGRFPEVEAEFARDVDGAVRGEMLAIRRREFILNAETLGYSTPRVVFVHALPNLLRANLVYSMSDIVLNILTLAALSYLGLGVAPPTPAWPYVIRPGLALAAATTSCSVLKRELTGTAMPKVWPEVRAR